MNLIDFPSGMWFHKSAQDNKFLSEFKRFLKYLRVTTFDPCCDIDSTTRPVRFNTETQVVEYYDPSSNTWINVIPA